MYVNVIYLFPILLIGFFLRLDGHNILKEKIKDNYDKWSSLNNLVSTKNKGKIRVVWISIKLLFQALYISFLQYMNNSLVRIDKNTYELTYVVSGKVFKNRFKIKRGPKPILLVSDENEEDVTDVVLPYFGPENNWHGNQLTPEKLGFDSLTFELSDGNGKTYKNNELLTNILAPD